MPAPDGAQNRKRKKSLFSYSAYLSESNLDDRTSDRAKGIVGKDVRHWIIFFPIGSMPTLEGALDDALEKGGGDVMTDAVVNQYGYWIPFIYGQGAWKVKGDVVKTRIK